MTTTLAPPTRSAATPAESRRGNRRATTARTALATLGAGAVIVVGLDGSVPWRVLRVVVIGALVWGLTVVARRENTLGRAAGLAFAGYVATVGGMAIAYPYLTTTGWTIRAIGAVAAVVGGLVLFVVETAAGVARLRTWRKLIVIPVVLAVMYAAGFPIAMSVAATNVPRTAVGSVTPADRGLTYENVNFRTRDGVRLSGWYVPSRNRAAVVLLHGASSTRSAVLDQAVALARHGYGVLLFDARGQGRSAGRAMNFGWYGDADAAAAVDYLANRPDVDAARIGALGESMGGEEAIGAMAHDPRLRAVVAEGATNRVAGDWDWLSRTYGTRGYVQRGIQWLTYAMTDLMTAARPPITLRGAVAAAAPRPVLLIAAGTIADEANADRAIQGAAPRSVDVWVVPGAAHTGGLRATPREWIDRVTTFFDGALRPAT